MNNSSAQQVRTYTVVISFGGDIEDIDAGMNEAMGYLSENVNTIGDYAITIDVTTNTGKVLTTYAYEPPTN